MFEYETSPNERAFVEAIAFRAGNTWTVLIVDGTDPTVEKRGAPISLALQSLRPKGYQRESFAGRTAQALDAAHILQLKEFIERSMQELGIPGTAVALIDGGKVVYAGGFGVRELGKPERVDENTLFMAASGAGILEIVEDHAGDNYRAVYTVRLAGRIRLTCVSEEIKARNQDAEGG